MTITVFLCFTNSTFVLLCFRWYFLESLQLSLFLLAERRIFSAWLNYRDNKLHRKWYPLPLRSFSLYNVWSDALKISRYFARSVLLHFTHRLLRRRRFDLLSSGENMVEGTDSTRTQDSLSQQQPSYPCQANIWLEQTPKFITLLHTYILYWFLGCHMPTCSISIGHTRWRGTLQL